MAINYAAYRRVSSDEQSESGNGLDTQEVRIKGLAKTHNLHIAKWYTDDITGTIPLEKRPDGSRLVKDIKAGKIQGIILSKVNRLSRDFADCLTLIRDLTRQGIKLYSADVGYIEDEQNIPMIFQAWTGQAERRDIVERTTEGKKRKAEKKQFVGVGGLRGTPYGYQRIGSGRDVSLAVDKIQAAIVREIYTKYNSGEGTRAICESLNKRHIQPPRSKTWGKINVIHILSNPIYKGVVTYGKISYTDDKLRIVTPQEWRTAEQNRKRRLARKTKNSDHLLSAGRLTCTCGKALVGTSSHQGDKAYSYYQCWTRSEYPASDPRRCTSKPIKASDIESVGLGWLVSLAISRDKLKSLIGDMQSRADVELEPIRSRRQSLVEMIDRTSKKITRTTRLMSDAESDEIAKSFEADLLRLNELSLGLKAQLTETDEELASYGIWASGTVTVEAVQKELQDLWQFTRVSHGMQMDFSQIDRAKARAVIHRYDLRVQILGDGLCKVSCALGEITTEIERVDSVKVTDEALKWYHEHSDKETVLVSSDFEVSRMNTDSYGSILSAKLVLSEIVPIVPAGLARQGL